MSRAFTAIFLAAALLCIPVTAAAGPNPNARFAMHTVVTDAYLDCSAFGSLTCSDIDNSVLQDEVLGFNFCTIALGFYHFDEVAGLEFKLTGWPTTSPPALLYCPSFAFVTGDPWDEGAAMALMGDYPSSDWDEMYVFAYARFPLVPTQAFWPFELNFAQANGTSYGVVSGPSPTFEVDSVYVAHGCTIGGEHIETAPYWDCGGPEQVDEYCRRLIQGVGRDGGFMLDAGGLIDNAKVENLRAMCDSVEKYG